MRLLGRGFLAEGRIERVALSRSTREPYDVEWRYSRGEFRIGSDRELGGLAFEDAPAGVYRVGLYHTKRGWYWSGPILSVDESGTVKYGYRPEYRPALRPFAGLAKGFSIYDAMAVLAMLFAAVGILLASRQVVVVAREGELMRREAVALISGGKMPQAERQKTALAVKRRGAGLRAKFTFTIAFLVLFVVLLLSVFLGYNMIRRSASELALGLDQRARVLLESVAQGGRFFIGKEDAVTQLSIFPSQARAMAGANYITITGELPGGAAGSGEVVYATSDPSIADKLEASTLNVDKAVVLGRSVLKVSGGDPLAALAASKAKDLAEKADFIVADQLKLKDRLAEEKAALKRDEAGNRRRAEINAQLDAIDVKIREKLATLSDEEVGTIPAFDPAALGAMPATYLYYKPIVEYRPGDAILYRGMVRLDVSTEQIKREVRDATAQLVRLTLIVAALALAIGVAGAFVLSSAIVRPIRKLVAQIERIRDTEDKEELEGSRIEVASRDELYTLAETVNQMTHGLVSAAKASKELIVGKGIQKMFIPLDPAPGTKTKLSTGRRDEKDFEVYGYYEGADAVSGDYWDFRSINQRYHYFIKCDVSGHGVSAALIMVQVATITINYFNDWKRAMPKAIDITDLAYKINDFLEERQFVGRFAAFTLGVWDSQEGVAYLCDAGDKILHVWDGTANRLLTEELPDSPAAGPLASILIQMKQPFKQVTRKLRPNDILFLYTDGIEESKRYFRDSSYAVAECAAVPKDEEHANHKGGENNEEFGNDRLTAILEALARRGSYRLERQHDPAEAVLSFDFSTCEGSLEEKIIAPLSVEKVYRFYRDEQTTDKDTVLVDEKIDAFLAKHFDQYRLYCSDKRPNPDAQNPGYLLYGNLKCDSQYDDLTLLGIRRK
jgi:serine phosphatase RsbU (regulator of sigma subunit)